MKARIWAAGAEIAPAELCGATGLDCPIEDLIDRAVLIAAGSQLAAALALIELDGVARRLVIATPDLSPEHLPAVIERAGIDAVVTDGNSRLGLEPRNVRTVRAAEDGRLRCRPRPEIESRVTEWILMTSGTTGAPKLVRHTLATLTAAIPDSRGDADVVWATHYDMRRYGGLQIFLRALWGGGSFVMSDADESASAFLERLGTRGATHISGTPSHWRRALMSAGSRAINPRYVRMSGEIADQAIINSLRARYPDAGVSHAFASTEAGVGFAVDDGLAGFPSTFVQSGGGTGASGVDVRVVDGTLKLRSSGTALGYLGAGALADFEGFVDTGDAVELHGDRYYFLGRKSGMINIGGLKVYPEEVEATINRHPAVRMSLVRAKANPITGALVAAEVVLKSSDQSAVLLSDLKREILGLCRESLPAHKVPATIRFVTSLDVAAAGKLARVDA